MDIRVMMGVPFASLGHLATPLGSIPAGASRTSRPGGTNPTTPENPGSSTGAPKAVAPLPFNGILRQFLSTTPTQGLKISAHAEKRLQERQIQMTGELRSTLELALDELTAKGSRDSLALHGDEAFVVNVPTRTLITAMNREDMQNRIITQIDSVNITAPTKEAKLT